MIDEKMQFNVGTLSSTQGVANGLLEGSMRVAAPIDKPANPSILPTRKHEVELIICASCPYQIPEITARLVQLLEGGPVDWDFIEQEAIRHGVFPLIYANREVQTRVPAPILNRMGITVRSLVAGNMALSAELVSILELFRAEAIPVTPFKGPVLSVAAYGRISARTFSDLDILVRREDVSKAIDLLTQRGYEPDFDLTRFGLNEYLRSEHALPMHTQSGGVNLDLHWRLTERNFLRTSATEDLLSRTTVVDLMGYRMPSLCIEDLVLYLCVHGAKDDWRKLEWICCLVELIRTHPLLNWTFILQSAARTRSARALRLGLLLGIGLFRLTLPAEVEREARSDRMAASLANELVGKMLQVDLDASWLSRRTRRWVFLFRISTSWRDRFRMLFFTIFRIPHPESRELLVLPRSLRSAYYILRPMRLFLDFMVRLTEFRRS